MSAAVIYLDESGDMGWKFDQPYRAGGSSRYLTVGALIVPSDKTHVPKRLMKDLYQSRGWTTATEKKWANMGAQSRLEFATRASVLRQKNPEITYHTITVRKERVLPHIRSDQNKLYNYMIKTLLLDKLATFEHAHLIPDARTIKVESGNSLHDYLQTELWFTKNALTTLQTTPLDSVKVRGLQFVDMLAGVVSSHHEDNNSAPWNTLSPHLDTRRLFF